MSNKRYYAIALTVTLSVVLCIIREVIWQLAKVIQPVEQSATLRSVEDEINEIAERAWDEWSGVQQEVD